MLVKLLKKNKIFAFTVLLPTFSAVLYFGLYASDIYISESRFVVRSPDQKSASPLTAILKGTDFTRSQDDSYAVRDYVQSRDVLTILDSKLALRDHYISDQHDLLSRFAGLDWDDSFEAFHRYYNKRVSVQLDETSSISAVTVRAYDAQMAKRINEELLINAEQLVNQLNNRARNDMISFAQKEVDAAAEKAKAASAALSLFRDTQFVIDPERQSTIQLTQIAKLHEELIAARAQLHQLEKFTKDNPQIPAIKSKIQSLDNAIAEETARVTGGEASLAKKAAEYQMKALERDFADKQLAIALSSLEQARNDAQRKQLYLERIVQPSLPDTAMEPRRVRGVVSTIAIGLIAWGIFTMLLAGVREHQD